MKLLRRLRYFLHYRQAERDLAEEIETHREMSGRPLEMGNILHAQEDARAVWIWPWLESVCQDVAYALRNTRRQPGFTFVAVITLGAAIGLNASFFTLFNAVVVRPWPVRDPARMVKIRATNPKVPMARASFGVGVQEFRYLAAHTRTFDGITVLQDSRVHFGFEEYGTQTKATFVDGNHFRVLGVEMHLGRGFAPEEDRAEEPEPFVVLSYPLWRDHFASDSAIVGKKILVSEIPFTVIGVTSERFTGTSQDREHAWFPLSALLLFFPREPWPRDMQFKPDYCCVTVQGRLAAGVSRSQAQAEVELLSRQFRAQYALEPSRFELADPTFFGGNSRGGPAVMFALMFAGVTMIVLLACANVGNLLIARAAARQREISIRRSVGADRRRLVRQLLTESLILAMGAAGVGVMFGAWLPPFVFQRIAERLEAVPLLRLEPDWRVLAYTLAVAMFACIGFGLAPALHGTRINSLQSRLRLRGVLLAVQVAVSIILLTSAGLMIESVKRSQSRDLGFSFQDASLISFQFPPMGYDAARTSAFFQQLVRNLPDVTVGLAGLEPLADVRPAISYRLPGESGEHQRRADFQDVSAGYFDVLRIPVVAGRAFDARNEGGQVAVVNQTFATLLPGGAVGKELILQDQAGEHLVEIVGVVRDANITGSMDQIPPIIFRPFVASGRLRAIVRSTPGAAESIAAVASAIDPRVRIQVAPLAASVERWLSLGRVAPGIASLLGLFALTLSTVGMFGVFAYAIQQRTKEIGIRLALGARPREVIRLLLAGSSRSVTIGLAIGFVGAIAASQVLARSVYGVGRFEPLVFLGVAGIITAASFAASLVPARQAMNVNPVDVLRQD